MRAGAIDPRNHLPSRTIRLRLTLTYGLVFLLTGVALLTIGYLLVRHDLHQRHNLHDEARGLAQPLLFNELSGRHPAGPPGPSPTNTRWLGPAIQALYAEETSEALHRLLIEYITALLVMTAVSVAAGWLLAGRALAPLRAITATARRVSGENLGERIALEGPADELRELADTFDGMLTRLDRAFGSQRHFVANASHELRTPLAIMRTEVDVALADPDASAEELRAMGEAVRETIDRSEALLAALLMLARSEAIVGRGDTVDLAEMAAACITDLHARAEASDITIATDLRPALTCAEPALAERVVANLVDNAIRHNVPGGGIKMRTRTSGPVVELEVSNDGRVIDPAEAQGLTEPFRRLNRAVGGFGLGLSIVRSVAEAHGGNATVTARPEGGLSVVVQLPAAPGALPAPAQRGRRALTRS